MPADPPPLRRYVPESWLKPYRFLGVVTAKSPCMKRRELDRGLLVAKAWERLPTPLDTSSCSCCADHVGAEWVVRSYATAFTGPPVLCCRPHSHRSEVVFRNRGHRLFGAVRLITKVPLAALGLTQRSGTKMVLKLIFIYPDSTRYTDHAVGWNLALPNPEIYCVSGHPESIRNFPYFCESRRHRHHLVVSSNHGCSARARDKHNGSESHVTTGGWYQVT
jgi:hypothetical protein